MGLIFQISEKERVEMGFCAQGNHDYPNDGLHALDVDCCPDCLQSYLRDILENEDVPALERFNEFYRQLQPKVKA